MQNPGLLFVAATLLPLASFTLVLLAGAIRAAARPYRTTNLGGYLYQRFGGDEPQKTAAYVATGAIGLAFVLCFIGLIIFMTGPGGSVPHTEGHEPAKAIPHPWEGGITWMTLSFNGRPGSQLMLGFYIDSL